MKKQISIAIAGAGISGLASAIYLHRLGHRVCIFEQFETPKPVGSGLMLQTTGLTVLSELGLIQQAIERGRVIDGLVGRDARTGRNVLSVFYDRKETGRFGLAIHRSAIFEILYGEVQRLGVECVFGADVQRVDHDAENAILFWDKDQSRGFDLVLDCTGPSSKLRPNGSAGSVRKILEYGALWATLDWVDAGFSPHQLQQRYDLAKVMIGVLPLGKSDLNGANKVALFWSLKPQNVQEVYEKGLDAWKAEVLQYWPEVAPLLDQISSFDDLTLAVYGHHTMRKPGIGRLVHLGDSSHSTSPQLGQGANMALLDAAAFANGLARTGNIAGAADYYWRGRAKHVRVFQTLSLWLTPFYQSDGKFLPVMRDILMSTIGRLPFVQKILSKMISGVLIDPFSPIGLVEHRIRGKEAEDLEKGQF